MKADFKKSNGSIKSIRRISLRNMLNLIFVLAWCILILSFSSDNAAKSDIKSTIVVKAVKPAVVCVTKTVGVSKPTDDELQHFVRKSAHFLSYLVLGMLVFSMYKGFETKHEKSGDKPSEEPGDKLLKIALFSILTCFIFACFDEFYQTFIPGRAGMFTDALLDTAGSTLGVIVFTVLLVTRRKNYAT